MSRKDRDLEEDITIALCVLAMIGFFILIFLNIGKN